MLIYTFLLMFFCPIYAENDCCENMNTPCSLDISLAKAIALTLENENRIKISQLDIKIQEGVLQQSAGPFDPLLDGNLDHMYKRDLQVLSSGLKTDSDAHETTSTITGSKKTRLGTVYSINIDVDQMYNSLFEKLGFLPSDRTNTAKMTFLVDQPLLRNFYYGNDRMTEQANCFELKATRFDNLQVVSERIFNTTFQYWDLVATQKIVEIRRESEDRIARLLENTQRLIDQDQLATTDILQPQAQMAREKINLQRSEQDHYNSIQRLKLAMGILDESFCLEDSLLVGGDFPWVPIDFGKIAELKECIVKFAMTNRFDVKASIFREKASEALLKGAYNNRLPELNVFGGVTGSDFKLNSGAERLYGALDLPDPQVDWRIGLRLSIPFYNDNAMGAYIQRQAQRIQSTLETQQLYEEITAEVREALTNQLTLALNLKQAKIEVEKNTKLVEVERKKLNAGFSTIFFLIDFENRLTDSLSEYIFTERDYLQNIARIRFLTSTLVIYDSCRNCMEIGDVTSIPEIKVKA